MSTSIDIVYCWCSDDDPVWREKRLRRAAEFGVELTGAVAGECRYVENDDLRHSLRSLCRHAPWIGKVHVLVDDDASLPAWLDVQSDRMHVVRHSEVMPRGSLPCFDSMVIENYLFRINGLSERFLYANDDMLFARDVSPDFFFAADGLPVCRYGSSHADECLRKTRTPYQEALKRGEDLLRAKFGLKGDFAKAYRRVPHHNVDAYLRSDFERCYHMFEDEISLAAKHPFRGPHDIERTLYMGYALCMGRGHYRQARSRASLSRAWFKRMLRPGYADSLNLTHEKWPVAEKLMRRFRPALICFNDNESVTSDERAWLRDLYTRLYPGKCEFER